MVLFSVHYFCTLYCNTYRRFSDCQEFRVFIHENANDLQIYDHYLAHKLSQLTIRLTHFIEVMSQWISSNRLKLSASKTKFIWQSSTRHLARGTFDPIIINDKTISHAVHDLGANIDSGINLSDHISRLKRRRRAFSNSSTSVYPTVAHYRIFAHLGPGVGSGASRLVQQTS